VIPYPKILNEGNRLVRRTFVLVGLAICVFPIALDAAEFQAGVDTNRITVGQPFGLTVVLRTDGNAPAAYPTLPDLGGLKRQSGPHRGRQERVTNRTRSLVMTARYTLIAPAPGKYTIGPSQVRVGKETLSTQAISVIAKPVDLTDLPAELQGEPIVHPVTEDASVNQLLRGRAFVLPVASNRNPFVGEPFAISYFYYEEDLPRPSNVTIAVPEVSGMMVREVHHSQELDRSETKTIGGRNYRVSLAYRAMLTPTTPGTFMLDGFALQMFLPVERRNRRSQFSRPFFSNTIQMLARGGSIQIDVRPLPVEGRPPNFSGTVGRFTLSSGVDKERTEADDLVTLGVTLKGVGNVALASLPEFEGTDDFEVFDTTQETNDRVRGERLTGSKTFEFLLRPKRSGELTIPRIEYSIFDPERELYVALTTVPHDVKAEGVHQIAADGNGSPDANALARETNFHYIKPLVTLGGNYGAEPLAENLVYWALQFAALLVAGGGYVASKRRDALHPAIRRQRGAWSEFGTYMKAVVKASVSQDQQKAALALETGIRELIGDLFDLSPEGLTTEEIEQVLAKAGAEEEIIAAVQETLEICGRIRYAPSLATETDLATMATSLDSLLRRALR